MAKKHIVFGISGRAQSGKTTLVDFIEDKIKNDWTMLPDSFLELYDYWGHEFELGNVCRVIYFADQLKKICIELFGLSHHQVYDDHGKNEPIDWLKWENMPGVMTPSMSVKLDYLNKQDYQHLTKNMIFHEPGPMTGREFMEYLGTDLGRRINEHCWINATFSEIDECNEPTIFLIGDVRSHNEIIKIQENKGYVGRLTRNTTHRNTTIESQLDKDKYDWDNFNFVIDNQNIDVDTKNNIGWHKFLESINNEN